MVRGGLELAKDAREHAMAAVGFPKIATAVSARQMPDLRMIEQISELTKVAYAARRLNSFSSFLPPLPLPSLQPSAWSPRTHAAVGR